MLKAVYRLELEHQGKVETGFRDFGVISIELERVRVALAKILHRNVIECWLNECWWWSEGPYGADWQPRFRQSAPGQLWLQL